MTTSGFTSFTPDEKKPKNSWVINTMKQIFFNASKPVLFILQGGARAITSPTEEEGLVQPDTHFTIIDTRPEGRHLNVFIAARKTNIRGMWI